MYRTARNLPSIPFDFAQGGKRVLIGSGLRYDLAVKDPEYIKELVTRHAHSTTLRASWRLFNCAPEHTEQAPLSKMMKPGIGTYDQFKQLFEKYTKELFLEIRLLTELCNSRQ